MQCPPPTTRLTLRGESKFLRPRFFNTVCQSAEGARAFARPVHLASPGTRSQGAGRPAVWSVFSPDFAARIIGRVGREERETALFPARHF